jgi:hypothetical protein
LNEAAVSLEFTTIETATQEQAYQFIEAHSLFLQHNDQN